MTLHHSDADLAAAEEGQAHCSAVCRVMVDTSPVLNMNLFTLSQLTMLLLWCLVIKCIIYRRTTSSAGAHQTVSMHQWVVFVLSIWAEALVLYFLLRYHGEGGNTVISSVCYATVTSLDAFSSIFMILLTSTQYPSQIWIRWCRRFALVVAACVGMIMIAATLHEGENTVGMNMPVYMSQDAVRITVCVVALSISSRHRAAHHTTMLTQLSHAQHAHPRHSVATERSSQTASVDTAFSQPMLDDTAPPPAPRPRQSTLTLPSAPKRPGKLLWALVVGYLIVDITASALIHWADDDRSLQYACGFCVNEANELFYLSVFPAAVFLTVRWDCTYWADITNALLSTEEAQARVPRDLASLHDCLISREQFRILDDVVGAGSETGPLYGAVVGSAMQACVVKTWSTLDTDTDESPEWEKAVSEAALLLHAQGPCVVGMRGLCVDPPNVFLLMDRAKCDLYTLLLRPDLILPELDGRQLPLVARIRIASRVAEGMQRLHEIDLIHRDLKAQNVLLSHELLPLISDFGVARVLPPTYCDNTDAYCAGRMTGGVGTGYIRAPEVETGVYGKSADVFAFGLLLWMCVAHPSLPLPGQGAPGAQFDRLEPKRHLPSDAASPQPCTTIPEDVVTDGCPVEVVSTMCACWGEPENRPTFESITVALELAIVHMSVSDQESGLLKQVAPRLLKNWSQEFDYNSPRNSNKPQT